MVTYLQLHFTAPYLALNTTLATDMMIYDKFTNEFSDMVSLSLTKLANCISYNKWNSGLSVIFPLYLVGLKC